MAPHSLDYALMILSLLFEHQTCWRHSSFHVITFISKRTLTMFRDHPVFAPSQWETTLQCNTICHWLSAYTDWSLHVTTTHYCNFLLWFQCSGRALRHNASSPTSPTGAPAPTWTPTPTHLQRSQHNQAQVEPERYKRSWCITGFHPVREEAEVG